MRTTEKIESLIKKRRYKATKETYEKTLNSLLHNVAIYKKRQKSILIKLNIWRMIVGSKVGSLAAAFLLITLFVVSFILSEKIVALKDELQIARSTITNPTGKTTGTINFYLREHQDVIARKASLDTAAQQTIQMYINQNEILYYEFLEDGSEYMRPGIIVKGPLSQHQINSEESPLIANGHSMTLSEARETTNFEFISPLWFRSGFILDKIIKIDERDALHLLYTDEINTVSLFEQPLNGNDMLEPEDFREYAVYRNQGQSGSTILAWRDNDLSYVLIGNIKISQLMDMAQSINSSK